MNTVNKIVMWVEEKVTNIWSYFINPTIAEEIETELQEEYGGGAACFYDPATGRRECE